MIRKREGKAAIDKVKLTTTAALSATVLLAALAVAPGAQAHPLADGHQTEHGGRARANAPWYPSLQAFEHYDSARSHVFSRAQFRGSFRQPNTVAEIRSRELEYPSGYNMSYLNENEAFIQGGSYGNLPGSIGPFVAKVNPRTLERRWFTLLRNTKQAQEWDYPGAMAIMNDGYIYVVSGYYIYKVDPADGSVFDTLKLPTSVHMRNNYPNTPATYDDDLTDNAPNTSYNGINALADGTIIVKSLYRAVDCDTLDGSSALLECPDSRNVPQSVLITVDPGTETKPMTIIQQLTLLNPAAARPTISRYNGMDYVYLVENASTPVRYMVTNGFFTEDDDVAAAGGRELRSAGRRLAHRHERLDRRGHQRRPCDRTPDGVRHPPGRRVEVLLGAALRERPRGPRAGGGVPRQGAQQRQSSVRRGRSFGDRPAGRQLGRYVARGRPQERPVLRRGDARP